MTNIQGVPEKNAQRLTIITLQLWVSELRFSSKCSDINW